jgi:HD-GYP domain-containing protein (c-di-GMP phosphodiesterase class II)
MTLLVETNPQFEKIYELNLLTWLGLTTDIKENATQAMIAVEVSPKKYKLIIVRSMISKEETAATVIAFLKSKAIDIPVIVVGPGKEIQGAYAFIPNSLQIKSVIQASAKALGITAQEMMNKIVPEYFPIPAHFFLNLRRSACPIFRKSDNEYKVEVDKLKLINPDRVQTLIAEGTDTLYVDRLDRLEFVSTLTSEMMSNIDGDDLSKDELIVAQDRSLELLSKKLLTFGVTEDTTALAHKNIESMKKNVKSYPKLAKLLERLLSNQASYLYKHTQILTYICLHIIKNIDWGSPEQEEKISFIAFFHDIVLETDIQGQIKSNSELKRSTLTLPEKQLVERHAQMAAEYIQKFPHAPMGADQIIRQHHGTLNGIGFSDHYGNNVSPMAIVLIIAEEFTRIIMKNDGRDIDKVELIRELKTEFPTSRFQKIIDLLQTITV